MINTKILMAKNQSIIHMTVTDLLVFSTSTSVADPDPDLYGRYGYDTVRKNTPHRSYTVFKF